MGYVIDDAVLPYNPSKRDDESAGRFQRPAWYVLALEGSGPTEGIGRHGLSACSALVREADAINTMAGTDGTYGALTFNAFPQAHQVGSGKHTKSRSSWVSHPSHPTTARPLAGLRASSTNASEPSAIEARCFPNDSLYFVCGTCSSNRCRSRKSPGGCPTTGNAEVSGCD